MKRKHPVLYRRPQRIGFEVTDPFDGFRLFSCSFPFNADDCANGEYRQDRLRALEMATHIARSLHKRGHRPALRTRQPKVRLLLDHTNTGGGLYLNLARP